MDGHCRRAQGVARCARLRARPSFGRRRLRLQRRPRRRLGRGHGASRARFSNPWRRGARRSGAGEPDVGPHALRPAHCDAQWPADDGTLDRSHQHGARLFLLPPPAPRRHRVGGAGRDRMESLCWSKGALMFPTASDKASVVTIDLGILLGLLVIARLLNPGRACDRVLFGLTTAAFLVIYALWRVCDTLPAFALTAQSLWPRLFIAFELIAILYTLMSILILFRSADRTAQADAAQFRLAAENAHPAVDVFICTYDEPIEVVERSILSALALDYPRFTVWVLDDTRRDWLRDYCAQVGARHLTRPDNRGAKAGNLNNGLATTARARPMHP